MLTRACATYLRQARSGCTQCTVVVKLPVKDRTHAFKPSTSSLTSMFSMQVKNMILLPFQQPETLYASDMLED